MRKCEIILWLKPCKVCTDYGAYRLDIEKEGSVDEWDVGWRHCETRPGRDELVRTDVLVTPD